LDMATAPYMDRALSDLMAMHAIVLDLSGLTFADSTGVRPIWRAVGQASHSGTSIRLIGARPNVEQVLQLTALTREKAMPS
jgi:anti-anti-sigma factor